MSRFIFGILGESDGDLTLAGIVSQIGAQLGKVFDGGGLFDALAEQIETFFDTGASASDKQQAINKIYTILGTITEELGRAIKERVNKMVQNFGDGNIFVAFGSMFQAFMDEIVYMIYEKTGLMSDSAFALSLIHI